MQCIKQSMVALSVLLIGIGCSENRSQKELTDETIQLNNATQTYQNKTLIDQGAINPKTLYLKNNNKDVEVEPKIDTVEHTTVPHKNDVKTIKLISERDATIMANLEMEKVIANLKSEKLTLNKKIEQLMKAQKEHKRLSKEKITTSASALLAAQQLTSDRDAEIAKLIAERDEAIKVTLQMQKTSADLESQKLNLDGKIQSLMQTQSKHESSLQEKITAAATAVEQLTADKDAQIANLIQERDEAIAVTLKMKKDNANFEAQISQSELDTNAKIEALKLTQEQTERALEESKREVDDLTNKIAHLNDDLLREKESFTNFKIEQKQIQVDLKEELKVSASKLTDAKSLASDRDGEISRLTHERDDAIKVTLDMQKANADLKAQMLELDKKVQTLMQTQSDNDDSSQKKIAAAALALQAAQQLTADRDSNIEKLIEERDEAINITLGMKKSNAELETQKLELDGKIQTLMQTQSEHESSLKKKITEAATAVEQLTADKDAQIAKLIQERDEAIKVTLEMKKTSADLEAEKLELSGKVETLTQTQNDNASSTQEKVTKLTALITEAEKLALAKDQNIEKLIKERDDAIQLTLSMQKASADLESQKTELSEKIQTLMQTQSDNASSTQEKVTKLTTLITEAEALALAKDKNVAKLVKERDEAIQVSIGLKKDYEAEKLDLEKQIETLKQNTTQNESLTNEKISKLTALLEEAEKTVVAHDTNIEKLTKERDAAIQASMDMQKKLEDSNQKIELEKQTNAENAKKLVIDNIVNTFKLSKVEFKTASAILTDQSTLLLDKVAEIMKNHSEYHYKIQGHTDSQGTEESNLILSQERAESVKAYLISKGIAESQLSTEGFGASVPIADNATKEGRLKNRRVVFEIVN